jgi:hypothetical protein
MKWTDLPQQARFDWPDLPAAATRVRVSDNRDWRVDEDRREGGARQVVDQRGFTICFMATAYDEGEEDEILYNARLIARAPVLLDLLWYLVNALGATEREKWPGLVQRAETALREVEHP